MRWDNSLMQEWKWPSEFQTRRFTAFKESSSTNCLRLSNICPPLQLPSCSYPAGLILQSSKNHQQLSDAFRTQRGGRGAQRRPHFNGFPIVTQEQISTLSADNLALAIVSWQLKWHHYFVLLVVWLNRKSREARCDFHQCLINSD